MKRKTVITILSAFLFVLAGIVVLFSLNHNKVKIDFKVPNYYSLAKFNYGGDVNEFSKDTYNLYKSIENKDGVYIINTSYISSELLKVWKDGKVYKSVPDNVFWEFTASPSYLKQINIHIEQKDLDAALGGVRLYLVPDTLSDEEFKKMKSYLEESALYESDKSIIKTSFVKNKEIRFVKYSPKSSYFTWPSEKGEPITDNSPIIFVCTAENMKYFESESLYATGVDSYIKFADKEAAEKFTDVDYLKKYNLNFMPSSKIYKDAAKNKLVITELTEHLNNIRTARNMNAKIQLILKAACSP